jgi:iron complex outermembrane receptor protein
VLWGAGLRHSRDRIQNSAALALIPADKNLKSWNVYLVDEIALGRNLDLSVGAKVDHNSYTGAEFLPSVRMGWRLTPQHLLWGAGSRAVRTPSRFDRELFLPGNPPFLLAGGPEFESEVANVYEIGYRGQLSTDASLSATAFFHDLDKVRTVGPGPGAARVENNREGHTRGIETWGALRVTDGWRLQAGYTHLDTRLSVKPGQVDLQPPQNIGSDPRSWWNLRSTHDLGGGWEFDVLARHHGVLANRGVPSYTAVDLRVGWRAPALDVSLLLQNLFDPGHIEWAPAAAQLERAALVKVTLRF